LGYDWSNCWVKEAWLNCSLGRERLSKYKHNGRNPKGEERNICLLKMEMLCIAKHKQN
jgi:hypothetical protein